MRDLPLIVARMQSVLFFYPSSPRAVTVERATECVAEIAPFTSVVALFVNETADNIQRVIADVPIDVIQFHGDESPGFCAQFNRPYIKALRVKPSMDVSALAGTYSTARGILLDTWVEGVPGGTGQVFDWKMARQVLNRTLVLAGGLEANNVGRAIAMARPAAVDTSGGVESAPGIKSATKIREFIAAVRAADQHLDGK